jgi:hypothetical protein
MRNDQRIEVRGIGQAASHDEAGGHCAVSVGEGDRACFLQQAYLGHLRALEAVGEGAGGKDVDACGCGCATGNEIHQCGIVDHGLGDGHHDKGRDAAGGCRVCCRCERLAVLGTRFAGEDAHVDEARGENGIVAVHNRRA